MARPTTARAATTQPKTAEQKAEDRARIQNRFSENVKAFVQAKGSASNLRPCAFLPSSATKAAKEDTAIRAREDAVLIDLLEKAGVGFNANPKLVAEGTNTPKFYEAVLKKFDIDSSKLSSEDVVFFVDESKLPNVELTQRQQDRLKVVVTPAGFDQRYAFFMSQLRQNALRRMRDEASNDPSKETEKVIDKKLDKKKSPYADARKDGHDTIALPTRAIDYIDFKRIIDDLILTDAVQYGYHFNKRAQSMVISSSDLPKVLEAFAKSDNEHLKLIASNPAEAKKVWANDPATRDGLRKAAESKALWANSEVILSNSRATENRAFRLTQIATMPFPYFISPTDPNKSENFGIITNLAQKNPNQLYVSAILSANVVGKMTKKYNELKALQAINEETKKSLGSSDASLTPAEANFMRNHANRLTFVNTAMAALKAASYEFPFALEDAKSDPSNTKAKDVNAFIRAAYPNYPWLDPNAPVTQLSANHIEKLAEVADVVLTPEPTVQADQASNTVGKTSAKDNVR